MACYLVFGAAMIGIGLWQGYGIAYFAGIAVALLVAGYHYRLIRDRSREGAFKAFRHNNWIGAAVFVGIACDRAPWQELQRWMAP